MKKVKLKPVLVLLAIATLAIAVGVYAVPGPDKPTDLAIVPASGPYYDDTAISATATGNAAGDPVEYRWRKQAPTTGSWSAWSTDSTCPPHAGGETWRVEAASHRISDNAYSTGNPKVDVYVSFDSPTPPGMVWIEESNPTSVDDLHANATGGNYSAYDFLWQKWDGVAFVDTANTGDTLPAIATERDDQWRVRGRTFSGDAYSSWVTSDPVTILDAGPSAPTSVTIAPLAPVTADDLVATASGGSDPDAVDNPVSYEYKWQKWDGVDYADTGDTGDTLPASATEKAEQWRAAAKSTANGLESAWAYSDPVTIGDTAPNVPTSVSIAPAAPGDGDDLTASAVATDPDAADNPVSFDYKWQKWDGLAFTDTGDTGDTLPNANTALDEQWRVAARSVADGLMSDWAYSDPVIIGNTPPTEPTDVDVTPASPLTADDLVASASGGTDADAGDNPVSYEYKWQKWDGAAFADTGDTGDTLPAANTEKGDQWRAAARTVGGLLKSAWAYSDPVTVGDTAPDAPTTIDTTPATPASTDDLTASASGGSDPDSADNPVSYEYKWAKWDGAAFVDSGDTGATLPESQTTMGDMWQAAARSVADGLTSGWVTAGSVTIGDGAPSDPTSVDVNPNPAVDTDVDLVCVASGSTDPESDAITYEYAWWVSTDAGSTFGDSGQTGDTLANANTNPTEVWQCRARAAANGLFSDWVPSNNVTINDYAPSAPTSVTIAPSPVADDGDNLDADATGSVDPDGTTITYDYEWATSTDGGATWSAWNPGSHIVSSPNTTPGERYKVRARGTSGALSSDWVESDPIKIGPNSAPTVPTGLDLLPAAPTSSDALSASGAGSTDADFDPVTYEYQWAKSADGGGTWTAFGFDGASVAATELVRGDQWKAQVRASDGASTSAWYESPTVLTILNSLPSVPASITKKGGKTGVDIIATANGATDKDADTLTYRYAWQKSTDGGTTWTPLLNARVLPAGSFARGDMLRVRGRANDGFGSGPWITGSAFIATNGNPTAPTSVTITPASPDGNDTLTATASGSTDPDGDALTYRYAWYKSTNGGSTWTWVANLRHLPDSYTSVGQMWKVHARANDGTISGAWAWSDPVTISAPAAPSVSAAAASAANGTTQITVNLTAAADVTVQISNIAGRTIAVIAGGPLPAGVSTVTWNGRSSSGTAAPCGRYLATVCAKQASGGSATCQTPFAK